jgi:ribosomal protein S18 acetylase RimI-like enzyme
VPDISAYLMKVGGRLGIVQQLGLLATRSRYRRDAVLVIKGAVPDQQGRGYVTLLTREVHRHLETAGYRALRSTFVERDNAASAASYRRAGGRPLHGYTFYERAGA